MIKERAMELVAALRSGKYQQAKDHLHPKDGYCCLGVACDLYDPNRWSKDDDDCFVFLNNDSSESIDILSSELMVHFGFLSGDGRRRDCARVSIDGEAFSTLAEANDAGCTFEQIADYIEANWEQL